MTSEGTKRGTPSDIRGAPISRFTSTWKMVGRITEAARKGGEDEGWLYLFGVRILEMCDEIDRQRRDLEMAYDAYQDLANGGPPR